LAGQSGSNNVKAPRKVNNQHAEKKKKGDKQNLITGRLAQPLSLVRSQGKKTGITGGRTLTGGRAGAEKRKRRGKLTGIIGCPFSWRAGRSKKEKSPSAVSTSTRPPVRGNKKKGGTPPLVPCHGTGLPGRTGEKENRCAPGPAQAPGPASATSRQRIKNPPLDPRVLRCCA